MKIYEYPRDFFGKSPKELEDCVLTLGFFDGVHTAHRDLLMHSQEIAAERKIAFGVFTFRTDDVIKTGLPRIYGNDEKLELIDRTGAEFVIIADFSAICSVSAEDFVKKILISDCKCKVCVAGFNFRFGKGASGNAEKLAELMTLCGGEAVIRSEMKHDGATVSTTLIRSLLECGEIEKANRLLGAPYFIRGEVTHGKSEGRGLGYPTVNTTLDKARVSVRIGVYRSAVVIDGKIYSALTNIGKCPTFGERDVHSETYILDFDGDLYGRTLDIYLLGFLREEMLFPTAEALLDQISIDKKKTIIENGDVTWQELGLS